MQNSTLAAGERCTDKVRRRCWTYDAGATGWQKSWREAKAAKGQRQKQDAALKTAALHLNLTPRANGHGATNDRTATTGAALPSIFAGRSMLRPYEAAPRVRRVASRGCRARRLRNASARCRTRVGGDALRLRSERARRCERTTAKARCRAKDRGATFKLNLKTGTPESREPVRATKDATKGDRKASHAARLQRLNKAAATAGS